MTAPSNAIPFTQFLRPNGRRVDVWIERPEPIVAKAREIIAAGYEFQCEELTTGHAHLTISDGEDDVAGELCMNGPAVPDAVDRLVSGFTTAALSRQESDK